MALNPSNSSILEQLALKGLRSFRTFEIYASITQQMFEVMSLHADAGLKSLPLLIDGSSTMVCLKSGCTSTR